MKITGNALLARALARQRVETAFFLMGGPMLEVASASIAAGIRLIDVRHEQAAAMMAQAYARVLGKTGVCMAASGPGVTNLTTGLANSLIDCVPVVALGGASPVRQYQMGSFQEIDQVAIMRPVTKWAERVYETRRIPEYVELAFRIATAGKPGPVYLDLPGDLLYAEVDESDVVWGPDPGFRLTAKASASPAVVEEVISQLEAAKRPVIISGSGILWSGAAQRLKDFVEKAGIPFYTTPQGRGVVPEDHPFFFGHARSTAFKESDLVLVLGTRLNFVFAFGKAPRFNPDAKFIRIDIDPDEVAVDCRSDIGIVADVGEVLFALNAAIDRRIDVSTFANWREHLAGVDAARMVAQEEVLASNSIPIHPLRLCRELRDFMSRDDILVVDGQEILNYGRMSLPSFVPGHRLNSGPFGTMGVGLPFGLGAKAAKPDARVVVLHGDGSFGLNAMEIDTAVRHNLPVLIVISLNGGWTADPDRKKPGRDLGYTRFDKMAEVFGCHGEYVDTPDQIRPALERAAKVVDNGRTALLNVVTDWKARAVTAKFSAYQT